MTKSIDRRSTTNGDEPDPSAFKNEQERVEKAAGVSRRADGAVRRIEGTGVRSLPDFFDPSKTSLPMTRGDFTRILALLYHNEEQTSWWGRIVRWSQDRRQVGSVRRQLLAVHKRALAAMAAELQQRLEQVAEKKHAEAAK
jgi:hypothetical protein